MNERILAMPANSRNGRTPDGGKRRWTPDDRARRAEAPGRGRTQRGDDLSRGGRAGGARAERRATEFGGQQGDRQDRRPDWFPGGRTEEGARGGRPRQGDRPVRGRDDRGAAPRSGDRSFRDDRPAREDRPFRGARPGRDEAPSRSFRDERPARDGGQRFRDERPGRDDRPFRDDAPRRASRDERPARDEGGRHPSGAERPFRGDRPQRDERPFRQDGARRDDRRFRDDREQGDRPSRGAGARPQRDDRPFRSERPRQDDRGPRPDRGAPRRDDRPFREDRPRRDDRQQVGWREDRPVRDDRPRRSEDRGGDRRDDRAARWEAPEDVVLERLQGEVVTADEVSGHTFADLGLGQRITEALAELGAVEPFPIQAATIPDALAGRNVLGRGRTGSGKTIAFGAALVERLLRNWAESDRAGTARRMGRAPRALILAPTRELALQIDRTVQPISRSVGLFTTQIVGGVPQGRQVGALSKGVDIVIGTPGRIEDLLEQGRLDLSEIEIAVLDEADHMAELGFLEPMQRLLRRIPRGGQRMLFSATLDTAVAQLVEEFLPKPSVHEVAEVDGGGSADHRVLLIDPGAKLDVLTDLIGSAERTLVFARTRAFAEQLADELDGAGIRAESLHGDLNQGRRSRNLQRFTDGKVSTLVATDVAARGIHVDDIDLVIHADAAEEYKTYLHRSGRTGRAGATGTVVTLINARRRRRFTELLERAGVEATFVTVHPGDDVVAAVRS